MNNTVELIIKTPDGKVENRYKITWPTIQQIIDIESSKLQLSKGKYTELLTSNLTSMHRALDYIDMISYLSIMCPKLLVDMKVDIREVELTDAHKGLMSIYKEQFLPWWNEYEDIIKDLESPKVVDTESEDDQKGA